MSEITIIDYGVGNLLSITRAFEACGASVRTVQTQSEIAKAKRLVLPGVGAFADGMKGIESRGLAQAIRDFASSGRPLLGICLGMQMLLDLSEEFGEHPGLGIIPGRVRPIPLVGADGLPHKIPHIGWNALLKEASISWEGSILNDLHVTDSVYYVHSFAAAPSDPNHVLAYSLYNGIKVTGAIRSHNVYGCQFHPEKSGIVGLKIIRTFCSI